MTFIFECIDKYCTSITECFRIRYAIAGSIQGSDVLTLDLNILSLFVNSVVSGILRRDNCIAQSDTLLEDFV